jgi:hypothetical protein
MLDDEEGEEEEEEPVVEFALAIYNLQVWGSGGCRVQEVVVLRLVGASQVNMLHASMPDGVRALLFVPLVRHRVMRLRPSPLTTQSLRV